MCIFSVHIDYDEFKKVYFSFLRNMVPAYSQAVNATTAKLANLKNVTGESFPDIFP